VIKTPTLLHVVVVDVVDVGDVVDRERDIGTCGFFFLARKLVLV
jgi:hypothetical protein